MASANVAVVLLAALPWLNPFAPPPTPAVAGWLLASTCAILLWLFRARSSSAPLLLAWILAAVVSAAIGLLQYLGQLPHLEPWLAQAVPGLAYGNLRQRNQFATLMNIGLVALLSWSAHKVGMRRRQHFVIVFAAVLLAAGTAASTSRTGLLQLFLLFSLVWVWGAWQQPRPRQLMLFSALAYLLASLLLPTLTDSGMPTQAIWSRLQTGDQGCNGRLTLWRNVVQLISEKTWAGWGWGELDYAHFMTLYEGARFCEILDNAHNLPLHLAVELGVPAATLICGLGLALIWRQRPWRETDAARQAAWAVLGLILVHSMLEYPLWYGPFQLTFLTAIWLLRRATPEPTGSAWVPRPRDLIIAAGALAALAYAAWDYHLARQIYLPPDQRSPTYREYTLEKIGDSRLYREQVQFAIYLITPLAADNADRLYATGLELLHFSPEPKMVAKLVDAARMLGHEEEACSYERRFQAAYPHEYQEWRSLRGPATRAAHCPP